MGEETNRLLRLVVMGVNNSTLYPGEVGPLPFAPPNDGVLINQLFSVSLTLSLLAAFGALVGQQWIASYNRRPSGGFEKERRERQRRLLGAKRWRLEHVLDLFLPILLQVSVIVFLVGMAAYFQSLCPRVARPNIILSWCGAGIVILTIIFAISDPYCPFKTPLSQAIASLLNPVLHWLGGGWPSLPPTIRFNFRWIKLSNKASCLLQKWLLRRWSDEMLEAHSLRRILATSVDTTTLHSVALNIPLITSTQSLEIIYGDSVALNHLRQLYEAKSAYPFEVADPAAPGPVLSGAATAEAAYASAICHIVLAAGNQASAWTSSRLQDHERELVFSAAQHHVRYPENSTSLVPSAAMTVAIAYLMSERDTQPDFPPQALIRDTYLDFLQGAITSAPMPGVPIAAIAWILISSPTCMPVKEMSKAQKKLPLGHPASGDGEPKSDVDLLSYASKAYQMFYQSPRYVSRAAHPLHRSHFRSSGNVYRIPSDVLCCVAAATSSYDSLTELARPWLISLLENLAKVLNYGVAIEFVSGLSLLIDALLPLHSNDVVGPSATELIHAILKRPESRDVQLSQDASAALKALELDDEQVGAWLKKRT